jgi:hypothetical protein
MRLSHFFSLVVIIAVGIFLLNCGGGSNAPGTVNLTLSDPPTCAAPQGPYSHVYVTVTDVLIHTSSTANANDPNWVDLTPNLKNNPVQVDLLAQSNQCFLAMLGSTGIPAGTYQQIRIILANNGAAVANNKCGVSANCLMLAGDPSNTPQALQLSSESQTGIKIPSGQIAGGKFVIGPGETKDLNLDFDACASVVVLGSGQYRLKPVLHAGEISLTSTSSSISGTIVDSAQQPLIGGSTVVALEQVDNDGVDRVIMQTVPNSAGGFAFCPVPDGTYDLVVSAVDGSGMAYAATVITGVQPGDSLGTVPLTAAGAPASIAGQVTTSTGTAGTSADVTVSALLPVPNSTTLVTVPLAQQSAATATLTTSANLSCPPNTGCANYTLVLPASNPSVGAMQAGNQNPAAPAGPPVNYTVDGIAFVPESGGTLDCSPSRVPVSPPTVTAGSNVNAPTIAFSGCQ